MSNTRPNRVERAAERGVTLLEVAIILALFVVAFLAVWQSFTDTGTAYASIMYSNDLDRTLRTALARVVEEVANSGTDESGTDHVTTHPPGADTTISSLTFQRRIAMDGVAADWSNDITFDLQPSENELPGNGLDDDADGVVDELSLVRTEAGGTTTVIADGVAALSVTRLATSPNAITVLITVTRPTSNGANPMSRTATTTVALRNRT